MTGERCEWTRQLLRVFFDEAVRAHDLEGGGGVTELLDLGQSSSSIGESIAAKGENAGACGGRAARQVPPTAHGSLHAAA